LNEVGVGSFSVGVIDDLLNTLKLKRIEVTALIQVFGKGIKTDSEKKYTLKDSINRRLQLLFYYIVP
jgi:hypothetical protein